MKKISTRKLFFIIPFLTIFVFLALMILNFRNEVSWQVVDEVSDQLSLSLRTELSNEKEEALRLALILSESDIIKHTLENDDDEQAFRFLKHVMGTIHDNTTNLMRVQIITADSKIFARSWDSENLFAGMPLDPYREDLDEVKRLGKPRSSIEVGRRLGIKATVPIYDNKKLLGFIEVLQFFDASTDFFHKFGIDLYVLLDDRYYNTAVLMQNNPAVAWYIVANRRYNSVNLKLLRRVDFKQLRKERTMLKEHKYIFSEPMKNGHDETIGLFVFVMPQKALEHFAESGEDLSFLLTFSRHNLYDIVKKEEYENKVYHSGYDKSLLLALRDTVPENDREQYTQEAREILSHYSKEELISLMLHYKLSRKIKGKIR